MVLDAGATHISISYDQNKKILTVKDNGKGMSSSHFGEYHDFAAGLKTRGTGIGFAGVGAKISFNIADRVITETKSNTFEGGSNWYLESKKKLVWEDVKTNMTSNGTIVKVYFRKETKPAYSDTNDIIVLLKRHYLPLFDKKFLNFYEDLMNKYKGLKFYSSDLKFEVNGQLIELGDITKDYNLDKINKFVPKRSDKGIGLGFLGLADMDYPLGVNICGILLCTHGKVIKADFFNQFPGMLGPRIFGLVEVPEFIKQILLGRRVDINTVLSG